MRANLDAQGIANQRFRSINWNAEATAPQTAVVCIIAALLSCCFTGFVFGVSNNLFHLPIMAIDRVQVDRIDETLVGRPIVVVLTIGPRRVPVGSVSSLSLAGPDQGRNA